MLTKARMDGWESHASRFVATRSDIGSDVIRRWAKGLPSGGDVLDIGCGAGVPVSSTLVDEGLTVFGIDASPTLVSLFRRRFGDDRAACETVQDSGFFGRSFDAIVAVGLMFLLSEEEQYKLINKVEHALKPDGRFLFSAPRQACEWEDMQTGQRSVSLGEAAYVRSFAETGLRLIATYMDEGGNHYFDAAPCPARLNAGK